MHWKNPQIPSFQRRVAHSLTLCALFIMSGCIFRDGAAKPNEAKSSAPVPIKVNLSLQERAEDWQLRCEKVKLEAPNGRIPVGSTFLACRGIDGGGQALSLAGIPHADLKWQIVVPGDVVINGLVENPSSTPPRSLISKQLPFVKGGSSGLWAIVELYTELVRADGSPDALAINERLSRVSIQAHVSVPDSTAPSGRRHVGLGGVLDQLIEPGGLTADTALVAPFPGYFDALGPAGYQGTCDSEGAIYRGQSASLSDGAANFCVYRPDPS